MKAYGMTRLDAGDDDKGGCVAAGRATGVYAVSGPGGDSRAFHSLRGGRKAKVRRRMKRAARREAKVSTLEVSE